MWKRNSLVDENRIEVVTSAYPCFGLATAPTLVVFRAVIYSVSGFSVHFRIIDCPHENGVIVRKFGFAEYERCERHSNWHLTQDDARLPLSSWPHPVAMWQRITECGWMSDYGGNRI